MQSIFRHFALCILSLAAVSASFAQQPVRVSTLPGTAGTPRNVSGDVFAPICKYISSGDAESLSAWFDDTLEISVLSQGGDASRAQARQIVKSFFETYTPRAFHITHTAGRSNLKYALADLSAGGESFRVTIFVNCQEDGYKIQQLKIERI